MLEDDLCLLCGVSRGFAGCLHFLQVTKHKPVEHSIKARKDCCSIMFSSSTSIAREYTTTSECNHHSAIVKTSQDDPWVVSKQGEVDGLLTLPCTVLSEANSIRVAPMEREYGGWDNVHFHADLRLPVQCPAGQGMVVTLEAMARECVAVALSPQPSFCLGKTYVVHFGASGNVSTVIRRRLPSGSEAVDVTLPSRVCLERDWVSYWVALVSGQVYVGVGKIPGKQCIGSLDDSLYHQLRSPVDAVQYVGLGNSALGRNARPLKIRNVCVTTVPPSLPEILSSLPADMPFVSVQAQEDTEETQKLLEEYKEECRKAKARAAKFGIPYKEPPPQAFFKWSQARRLRANPERGFETGFDIMSPEERAKQEARKARFKRNRNEEDEDGQDQMDDADENNADSAMQEEPIALEQAWDNEELVRPHRTDPPKKLWLQPPPDADEEEQFAIEKPPEPSFVPEKIHICSIDWAAFKQIRTDDIMSWFSSYGPSYVEWLGELSCNILFEDKYSASRALQHMSQELPSPPPPEVTVSNNTASTTEEAQEEEEGTSPPDFGNMGWKFCRFPIKKVTNDRYGRRGTTARVLMRVASSLDVLVERPTHWPSPPPGFSTKRVLGPGSDFDTAEPRRKKRRKNNPRQRDDRYDLSEDGNPLALGRGLQAGRDGFSVEELEAERAAKREQSDQTPDRGDSNDIEARDGVEE